MLSITLIIIIITCIISITAFNNEKIFDDLIFYPPAVAHQKQWYRFFTCGLIHADYIHLGFNMYSLWLFGQGMQLVPGAEREFTYAFGSSGKWLYLVMYVSSFFFCLIPTYSKNKDNANYRSLGASGAVSAVIFSLIFLQPTDMQIRLFFMPASWGIPAFIFGFVYLVISSYLDKRGGGNINHSAHIWGALYGIIFLVITGSFLSEKNLFQNFVQKIQLYLANF